MTTHALDWRVEWRPLALLAAVFLALLLLPLGAPRFDDAVLEGLALAQDYAQQHVLLCLVPAFFIAGAIAVFLNDEAVMRTLGSRAHRGLAYAVASVSGALLAVCSCTVLPLFAGIHRRGAGLGPATAFLYSGPAINLMAVVLTASVLGWRLGVARAVGAVVFSVVVGLAMEWIFRRDKGAQPEGGLVVPDLGGTRSLGRNALLFAALAAILVFANWSPPAGEASGIWSWIYALRWKLTALAALGLAAMLVRGLGIRLWKVLLAIAVTTAAALALPEHPVVAFTVGVLSLVVLASTERGQPERWLESSWDLAKQILPLLLVGVLVAGFLLGRPGGEGLIPGAWIGGLLGGNSLASNLFAAVAGAFMYFATLTEVPIVQGLLANGMGQGPALALLLAGPALSLPNMLVIASVLGWKKTAVYVLLVVALATLSGQIYGTWLV